MNSSINEEIEITNIKRDFDEIDNLQNELEVLISKSLYIDNEIYGSSDLNKVRKNNREVMNEIMIKN